MIRTVSYSEIAKFRQCPHAHMLGYRERWTSPTTSPALQKGTLFHAVLEKHYKALRRMQAGKLERSEFVEYVLKKISPLLWRKDGQTQNEAQELVHWMYRGYLDHYGLDDEWEILAVEHDAQVALPSSLPKRGKKGKILVPAETSDFMFKAKIDLVAKHVPTDRLYIWDHKSGANLPAGKELAIDDQFGLYTWVMRQLGKDVWGAVYNAARTQKNIDQSKQTLESRHSRTLLTRLDEELDIIAYEAFLTASRAYAIKEGMAERAPNTMSCKWGCEFLEACLAGRKGVDEREFLKSTGFKQIFVRH